MGVRKAPARRAASSAPGAAAFTKKATRPWPSPDGPPLPTHPIRRETFDSPRLLAGLQTSIGRLTHSIPPISAVRYDRDARQTRSIPTGPRWWFDCTKLFLELRIARADFQTPHPRDELSGQLSRDDVLMARCWWRRFEAHSRAFGCRKFSFSTASGLSPIRIVRRFGETISPLHLQPPKPRSTAKTTIRHSGLQALPVRRNGGGADRLVCACFDFPASHITTHAYLILGVERPIPAVFDSAALESRAPRPSDALLRLETDLGHPKKT